MLHNLKYLIIFYSWYDYKSHIQTIDFFGNGCIKLKQSIFSWTLVNFGFIRERFGHATLFWKYIFKNFTKY